MARGVPPTVSVVPLVNPVIVCEVPSGRVIMSLTMFDVNVVPIPVIVLLGVGWTAVPSWMLKQS